MTFEDLEAWSEARRVVNNVYAICRDSSVARDFGLCDQIRRAAVSIMTNIAEGFERIHLAEKLQFYNIARASAGETRSLSYVVEDNYPRVAHQTVDLRTDLIHLGRLITGLIRSTQQRQ